MTQSSILHQLTSVAVWKRGDQRAPHKPLLLLLALAALQRGEPRLRPYAEYEAKLSDLLVEFGPPRQSVHPEYPFWRLQNDGEFWDIPEREAAIASLDGRVRAGDIPPSILRDISAHGGFSAEVFDELKTDPAEVNRIVAAILQEHFAPSLHEDILDAVAMPWVAEVAALSARSAQFRNDVIRLYEHRCAMCGFDGRLGFADLALEAAHIKWFALGGPDEPNNGVLLCSIHHKALDRGAVSLGDDRRILVSQDLHGGPIVSTLLLDLAGRSLHEPVDAAHLPGPEFLDWHRREVFRSPARSVA